jgi:hypothetical protein
MCTLIGIDWSKNQHHICIVNEAGAQIFRFSIPHSTSGFSDLEARVNKLGVPLTDSSRTATPNCANRPHNPTPSSSWLTRGRPSSWPNCS